jgi:peptidoglycan/xylan/chitin deacetylase (PgdA/CDA1 family)
MDIRRTLRLTVLHLARIVGLFALARYLTRDKLRILAYHGGSLLDEHEFRPGLFMTGATFEQRMRFLVARGYPILTLDAALDGLASGNLPPGATVITIDDGWYGTYRLMAPVLQALGLPATLYVATYYLEKQTQVFNVAAAYVLWSARRRVADFSGIVPGLSGPQSLSSSRERDELLRRIEAHAEAMGSAQARQFLLGDLCQAVGVDLHAIEYGRILSFMSSSEARELPRRGIDLQLHTHRHRFPESAFTDAECEIRDNRAVLGALSTAELKHFCYPSGRYSTHQLDWLPRLGIVSAVTTDPGLNGPDTPRGELRRILDSEAMTLVEFEAELCGFRELFR